MQDVIIVVKGGCVQDVYVTDPEEIQVTLVDYDNLGFEENAEVTRGNYPVFKMDKDWSKKVLELVEDEEDIKGNKIKVWQPVMQCCTCENYFEKLTGDRCCPKCGSGNWVHGYIDEKGYYEDAR